MFFVYSDSKIGPNYLSVTISQDGKSPAVLHILKRDRISNHTFSFSLNKFWLPHAVDIRRVDIKVDYRIIEDEMSVASTYFYLFRFGKFIIIMLRMILRKVVISLDRKTASQTQVRNRFLCTGKTDEYVRHVPFRARLAVHPLGGSRGLPAWRHVFHCKKTFHSVAAPPANCLIRDTARLAPSDRLLWPRLAIACWRRTTTCGRWTAGTRTKYLRRLISRCSATQHFSIAPQGRQVITCFTVNGLKLIYIRYQLRTPTMQCLRRHNQTWPCQNLEPMVCGFMFFFANKLQSSFLPTYFPCCRY